MSINIKVKSMDELFVNVFDGLVDGKYADIQIRPSVFSYNNLMVSSSCSYKLDLGKVGLTPTRWPRLINDYVNRNKLGQWFPKVKTLNRGRELLFPFNEVKPVVREKMSNYNYGACLLGITYRAYPPKVTLFSRATNWSQIGALDLGLAHSFAWHIADYMGNITPDEMEFAWLNSNSYLMAITTLPFLVSHGRLLEVLNGDFLITKDTRNLLKYFDEVKDPKYAPITRMRKRIAYILDGTAQKVPVNQLRLFNEKEWEQVKEGVPDDKDFRKLRGGYKRTEKRPVGALGLAVTYNLAREVRRRESKLHYKRAPELSLHRDESKHVRGSKPDATVGRSGTRRKALKSGRKSRRGVQTAA